MIPLLMGLCAFAILFVLWREGFFDSKNVGFVLLCCGLTLAAVLIRAAVLDNRSGDYNSFLVKWVEFYRQNGGFSALGQPIGDYNLPYLYFLALFSYIPINDLYLIKLLSVAFDILLAFFAMRLCGLLNDDPRRRVAVFFAVLLLPTVVINSAWWAQCDSIYVAFALGSLYYALKRRPIMSVLFAALSFAFKLQAVFFLPVFAVLLMTKHVKIRHLLLFPLFFVALVLPAVAAGRPLVDAVLIYVNQTKTYSNYLTLNAPSIFAFFSTSGNVDLLSAIGIVSAFVFVMLVFGYAWVKRKVFDNRSIVMLTAALTIGIPFLLPSMHERYFYIAEVITVVCAASGVAHLLLPFLVQASSLVCYGAYMNRTYLIPQSMTAAIMMASMLLVSVYFTDLAPTRIRSAKWSGSTKNL